MAVCEPWCINLFGMLRCTSSDGCSYLTHTEYCHRSSRNVTITGNKSWDLYQSRRHRPDELSKPNVFLSVFCFQLARAMSNKAFNDVMEATLEIEAKPHPDSNM